MKGLTTKSPASITSARWMFEHGWKQSEIAREFGVCRRTIIRWLNEAIPKSKRAELRSKACARAGQRPPTAHGTRARYARGCRCRPCTNAAVAEVKSWIEKNRERVNANQRKRYWEKKNAVSA